MIKKENNFAYIDGANLDKGVEDLGWALDYKRFRVWLSEKYSVRTNAPISYLDNQRFLIEKRKSPR